MRTEDHSYLARKMIAQLDIGPWQKAAFVLGNIEPDYNRFSYLGKKKTYFANGHSYRCRRRQIIEFFERPYQNNVFWWRQAGIVFHYLTDSFSRPHNPEFGYRSAAHVEYEIALHEIAQRAMRNNPWKIPKVDRTLKGWLERRHAHYMKRTKGIQDDCYYIYTTVMAVWNWVIAQKIA